jgi:FkbM family methyltransferase
MELENDNRLIAYDHVDIGTSDFNIGDGYIDLDKKYLLIEPISIYLNNIPDFKNITKLNMAVSDNNEPLKIYYVRPENISKYNLPDWVRGCNKIGEKHVLVSNLVNSMGITEDIFIEELVPVITFKQLVDKYNIGHIGHLKIDTEGWDHVIFKDVVDCILNNEIKIEKITVEYLQYHNNTSNLDNLYDKIKHIYPITVRGLEDNLVMKKS